MPSINPKVIADLRTLGTGTSPAFLSELIDLFLKEAAVLVAGLRDSLASRDARAFERSAHTLKGCCGNLGAQAMSRLSAALEAAGRSGDWSRASELIPGLEEEFRGVQAELEIEKGRR